MLNKLQIVLCLDIVWFTYFIMLNKKTERLVLSNAGFQAVGYHPYQTEVIKTSIDHIDISLYIQLTAKKKVDS